MKRLIHFDYIILLNLGPPKKKPNTINKITKGQSGRNTYLKLVSQRANILKKKILKVNQKKKKRPQPGRKMDKSYGEKKRYGKMKFKTMRVHAFLNRLANDKTFGNTLPHRKTATLIHY